MGADLVLLTDCPVKQQLGDGDHLAGSQRLYQLNKLRSQADAVQEMLERDGVDPETATIEHVLMGPDGPVRKPVTVKEMRASSAVLDGLERHCTDCPAACFDERFGCVGFIRYPVPESAGAWIAQRIQPADTLGGWLLLKAIDDFGYDGKRMAAWRARELLAGDGPSWAVVKKGFLSKKKVSSDQVLEAVLGLDDPILPSHAMLVLLFLGALKLDGKVPASKDDPAQMQALLTLSKGSYADRRKRTSLDVGPASDEPGVAAMQHLLRGLYHAWLLDDSLHVDG